MRRRRPVRYFGTPFGFQVQDDGTWTFEYKGDLYLIGRHYRSGWIFIGPGAPAGQWTKTAAGAAEIAYEASRYRDAERRQTGGPRGMERA